MLSRDPAADVVKDVHVRVERVANAPEAMLLALTLPGLG